MTILPVETEPRRDPPYLGRGWGTIFGDGDGDRDGDKILSPKVGGRGWENTPHSVPDIYI